MKAFVKGLRLVTDREGKLQHEEGEQENDQ
jgi:hypothetical protein